MHGDLIGRSPLCKVRFTDPRVSESHAQVSLRSGSPTLLALRGRMWSAKGLLGRELALRGGQVPPHPQRSLRGGPAVERGPTQGAPTAPPRVPVDAELNADGEVGAIYVEGYDAVEVRDEVPLKALRWTPEGWTPWARRCAARVGGAHPRRPARTKRGAGSAGMRRWTVSTSSCSRGPGFGGSSCGMTGGQLAPRPRWGEADDPVGPTPSEFLPTPHQAVADAKTTTCPSGGGLPRATDPARAATLAALDRALMGSKRSRSWASGRRSHRSRAWSRPTRGSTAPRASWGGRCSRMRPATRA